MKHFALAAAICAASTAAASAATYTYSYQFNTGQVMTGLLEGDLQADGNTIVVTGAIAPSLDGLEHTGTLDQLMDSNFGTSDIHVTLDGSSMSFLLTNTPGLGGALEGVLLSTGPMSMAQFLQLSPAENATNAFFAGNWSIELEDNAFGVDGEVPLPASGVLLGFAVLGAGAAARRKARKA